jgi:hypothetical protein
MSEIFYKMSDFVISITGELSVKKVILIIVVYMLLNSKTTLGLLMRLFSVWIIYQYYKITAARGDIPLAVIESAKIALLIFWPSIIKNTINIIRKIKKTSNNIVHGGG